MKSWFEPKIRHASAEPHFVSHAEVETSAFVPGSHSQVGRLGAGTAHTVQPDSEQLEQLVQEAYERGLADGRSEGPEFDEEQGTRVLAALATATQQITQLDLKEDAAWRDAVIDLAMVIAEGIVRSELTVNRESLLARIDHALETLGAGPGICLEVAAVDLSWLEEAAAGPLQRLLETDSFDLQSSSQLASGEIRVTRQGATIHGSIDAMLDRFRRELGQHLVESETVASETAVE